MALPTPISISEQADQIRELLSPFAVKYGGSAEVVSNLKMMWTTVSMANDRPRIIIVYNGETIRGEFAAAAFNCRVDRQWIVAVTRGRGWNINRGDSLYKTAGNADPLYTVVETVRDLIRSMLGISEELPLDYKRISPMTSANENLDSYAIEFSTANDVPAIRWTVEGSPQVFMPLPGQNATSGPPPGGGGYGQIGLIDTVTGELVTLTVKNGVISIAT